MGTNNNMSNSSDSLVKEFLVESFEYLSTISEEITRLEKNPGDKELFNDVYRKFHTIKGSANLLQFRKLQEIAHSTESLLDIIRNGALSLGSDTVDLLLASVDAISGILKEIEGTGQEGGKEFAELRETLLAAIEKAAAPRNEQVIKDSKIFVSSDREEEAVDEQEGLERAAAEPVEESAAEPAAPIINTVNAKVDTVEEKRKGQERRVVDSVVRVDVNLLDKMMNIVGELVLNRNQILQFSNSIELAELHRLSQQLDAITTELQSDIMTTRMQPIGGILNKFERIVRDMAKEFGKKINLRIEGKATELDKTLLEAIKDPLTHMVRNAVDHGIETIEQRKAAGKPAEGTINIRAYHEGGQVTIEISDDGKGLSRELIKNKGIQKGVISQDQASRMTEKQLLALIFAPGFSTAEKVTNISGRGVGMDVVKTNVEKIGGSVDLESTEGAGTTFKLKIPLTLAIVPALIVTGGGESFAIPQTNLVELVRLEGEKKLRLLEKVQKSEFFRLRGELIPVLRLNNSLKLAGNRDVAGESASGVLNIIILNAEGRVYGLIVDTILDTEEIVVKPLSKQLRSLSVYAGATIMGDGRVALILDAVGFAYFSKLGLDKDNTKGQEEGLISAERQEFLLFRLSGSGVYGVPLSLVNRLEEFPMDRIEYTGDQKIIRYRDQTMPLISVEDAVNLATGGGEEGEGDIVPVFVLFMKGQYIGFMVREIIDIAVTESLVNSDVVDHAGILGAVFIGDKTVTILDIYAILETRRIGVNRKRIQAGAMNNTKTVLVVEDSPLFRKMNTDLLEKEGYCVLSANDGQEGLDLLTGGRHVDLVLSDIMMPKMGGVELARSIRRDKKFDKLPMIALTTKVSDENVKEGMEAGFQSYLEKYNKSEIVETVGRLLQ